MKRGIAKAIRSKIRNKTKPEEQHSTERNDPVKTASYVDGGDNNQQKNPQYPPSQYGIRQEVHSTYLMRQRLVNLLEERFPGCWSLKLFDEKWVIELPLPLSPEDLKKCEDGSTSGSTG
ncbi:hypothetical protein BDV24DRAFT_50380 [Aspergillus arachidicola]|uniref:Uncharacterized protein n=1 Tax=Aspergillus arachidicola TaxID=656916 RepID=A0A5N6Y8C9_9EURO|nr:hypothetical protein BDV24DRAFT_50380 [Aspergillus arachidicola]